VFLFDNNRYQLDISVKKSSWASEGLGGKKLYNNPVKFVAWSSWASEGLGGKKLFNNPVKFVA
jgi:hypothetical protein